MKFAHLQIEDKSRNKSTLIGYLKNGSIYYSFYGSWGCNGISFSLRDLGCTLPIHNPENLSMSEFKNKLIQLVDSKSFYNVINDIPTEVSFKDPSKENIEVYAMYKNGHTEHIATFNSDKVYAEVSKKLEEVVKEMGFECLTETTNS